MIASKHIGEQTIESLPLIIGEVEILLPVAVNIYEFLFIDVTLKVCLVDRTMNCVYARVVDASSFITIKISID